jgi:RNA polymerase sigma-70 factor (ECF subfamily)
MLSLPQNGSFSGYLSSAAVEREPVERDEILAKLRERIVRFAASHISRDTAEDLAQEVLMLLHEKYAHLDRPEDLLPLSLQIVRFKIMSLRRKAVRRGEYSQVSITDIQLPDLDANPADAAERREMLERLTQAVGQLGERCRELIRLKLEGKSFPEIQQIMGAGAINTVYTWDHRCRKNLLELMGGDWEPGKR